jgi:hypothetical protein
VGALAFSVVKRNLLAHGSHVEPSMGRQRGAVHVARGEQRDAVSGVGVEIDAGDVTGGCLPRALE